MVVCLHKAIDASEDTLDYLLSNNKCGMNNSAIKNAYTTIMHARVDIQEMACKLVANQMCAYQASNACDGLKASINQANKDLEDCMHRGMGLADLAVLDAALAFFK